MKFESISYRSFRNIKDGKLKTDSENVILTGINGQGKTNILESVYALSYGSSFRTSNYRELIKHGESEMSLIAEAVSASGEKSKIEFYLNDKKRKIILDGKEVRDRKELIYNFPLIVFSHEDINYVKGEPEYRRHFFDQTFSMFNPLYLDDTRKYRALLNQRNAAIKNEQYSLLSLYDERLASYGLSIMEERRKGVKEFNKIFPILYKKISQSEKDIKIVYQPSWSSFSKTEEITEYLYSTREKDCRLGTTTSGIHRDRYVVTDENGPFSQTGSTGQIRLASLLFRVAEAKYFTEKTKKLPIFLIDDVLLELDSKKRAAFLDELSGYSQAFYTFLPGESYFNRIKENSIEYVVKEGSVE